MQLTSAGTNQPTNQASPRPLHLRLDCRAQAQVAPTGQQKSHSLPSPGYTGSGQWEHEHQSTAPSGSSRSSSSSSSMSWGASTGRVLTAEPLPRRTGPPPRPLGLVHLDLPGVDLLGDMLMDLLPVAGDVSRLPQAHECFSEGADFFGEEVGLVLAVAVQAVKPLPHREVALAPRLQLALLVPGERAGLGDPDVGDLEGVVAHRRPWMHWSGRSKHRNI